MTGPCPPVQPRARARPNRKAISPGISEQPDDLRIELPGIGDETEMPMADGHT
jgi:hypothetical protein